MPIDASIPLSFKQPQPFEQISNLLNVARDSLSYQREQQTFDSDIAQRQAESSSAQSRATVDSANVQPLIGQQAANTSTAQTGAQRAQFQLSSEQSRAAQQVASGVISDPRITATGENYDPNAAIEAINEARPKLKAMGLPNVQIESALSQYINAAGKPGAVRNLLANSIKGGMSSEPQAGQSLIPASAQNNVAPDLNKNMTVYPRDQFGNPQAATSYPAQGGNAQMPNSPSNAQPANANAPAPPMTSFPRGESEDTRAAYTQQGLDAQKAALVAPQMHGNNKMILDEMDKVVTTGATGETVAKLLSIAGVTNGTAEQKASAFDLAGKAMERNAIASAAAMGPGTNAGLEAAVKANGSVHYNPTAIRTIAKLNDAIVTGTEKYNQGLTAAVRGSSNGVFATHDFNTQWAQNADVNSLKFLNAVKTGDSNEAASIVKSVGGKGSKGYDNLVSNITNLQSLTKTGSLPVKINIHQYGQ